MASASRREDQGNLYVTLNQAAPGLLVGIAGEFRTAVGATVPASLRVQGDVVAAGSTVDVVVGTTAHPIVVELRVETGFAPPTHPIRLQAVAARVTLVPDPAHPSVSMQLVLEQLSVDGEPPADMVLDVEELVGTHRTFLPRC